jgi:hypothetical protein
MPEPGYTAHYDGVQIRVYSDSPGLACTASTALTQAGNPFIPKGA